MCIRDSCGDVGQGKETDGLEERAIKTGASKLYIEDLTEEFITDAIFPCIKANAVYEEMCIRDSSCAVYKYCSLLHKAYSFSA